MKIFMKYSEMRISLMILYKSDRVDVLKLKYIDDDIFKLESNSHIYIYIYIYI